MKIAITSDLHLGLTSAPKLAEMLADMVAAGAEALCVAGDIGEPLINFEACLDQLVDSGIKAIGIVPGNHDVWCTQTRSSLDLYRKLLPGACVRAGVTWLEGRDLMLRDGTAVCGSVAWYDYSDQPPAVLHEAGALKGVYNNDGNYINWTLSDTQMAANCRQAVMERLARLQADPAVRQILLVTHVPIFHAQVIDLPDDPPISNLYFRNYQTGAAIMAAGFSKLRWVVSGHTHRGTSLQKILVNRQWLQVATVDSDYGWPRYLMLET